MRDSRFKIRDPGFEVRAVVERFGPPSIPKVLRSGAQRFPTLGPAPQFSSGGGGWAPAGLPHTPCLLIENVWKAAMAAQFYDGLKVSARRSHALEIFRAPPQKRAVITTARERKNSAKLLQPEGSRRMAWTFVNIKIVGPWRSKKHANGLRQAMKPAKTN